MATTPKKRTRPSPSIHEAGILRHLKRGQDGTVLADDDGNRVLNAAASKLAKGRARLEELAAAIEAVLGNPALADQQRLARAHQLREQFVAANLDAPLSAAVDDLAKALDSSRRESWFPEPPRDARGIALERDAARHIRELDDGKRIDFIRSAIEAGDGVTLSAAFSGPAYLTGFKTDEMREAMRGLWRTKAFPDRVASEKRIESALNWASASASAAHKYLSDLVDELPAAQRAREAEEAIATLNASIKAGGK